MGLGKFISNILFVGVFASAAISHIMTFEEETPKLVHAGIPEEYAQYCFGIAIGLLVLGTILVFPQRTETYGYMCFILFLIPGLFILFYFTISCMTTQIK